MHDTLKLACVQFELTGGCSFELFIKKIDDIVFEAKSNGAELVVLPELMVADLIPIGRQISESEEKQFLEDVAKNLGPLFFEKIVFLAKKHNVHLLAGTFPRWENNKVYNCSMLTYSDGTSVTQDKLFPTWWEKNIWNWESADSIRVFDAPWGKTVICICYDIEFPVITQFLTQHRPELILVPSCTETENGLNRVRWCAQARAIEHYAFVAVTGTIGVSPGSPGLGVNCGQAAILAPSDIGFNRICAEGQVNKPQIIYATINFALLRQRRQETRVYPGRDQIIRGKAIL